MKFIVTIFGSELFRVELIWGNPTEALADLIAGLHDDSGDEEEGDENEISGGQHLHSERDGNPRFPEDRYAEEYVDRPFGFVPPVTNPSC